jgi:hypothetical protein
MGGGISTDSVRRQENYVECNFASVRNNNRNSCYSDRQIRGKLRNEYHGVRNNNDYVLSSDWTKMRGGRQ